MQRSILLIDDEPDVLRSLGRFFERAGWEVHRAMTGEEGIRLYEAAHPDRCSWTSTSPASPASTRWRCWCRATQRW